MRTNLPHCRSCSALLKQIQGIVGSLGENYNESRKEEELYQRKLCLIVSWNTHSELRAGAWGKEGNKELCLWSYLIIFLPRLLPFWKASSWRTPHTFWWIHSRSPRGAFRKRLCAAASSCLSGRKWEKGRKRGEEERKTCTMFDQRGAESHQDGSRDQGFATKLREERLNETFEK